MVAVNVSDHKWCMRRDIQCTAFRQYTCIGGYWQLGSVYVNLLFTHNSWWRDNQFNEIQCLLTTGPFNPRSLAKATIRQGRILSTFLLLHNVKHFLHASSFNRITKHGPHRKLARTINHFGKWNTTTLHTLTVSCRWKVTHLHCPYVVNHFPSYHNGNSPGKTFI